MQSVYYRGLGTDSRQYDAALQCFQNRHHSIQISGKVQADELVIHVLNEHPEIFYVGQGFRVSFGLMGKTVLPTYLYSASDINQLRIQLEKVSTQIIRSLINDYQSDYDKVRVLHDYLKCNLEYDMVAANTHQPNERKIAEAHSIIGALLNHKCVCEGFAKAFKYLCDKIGLECWVVCGKGSSAIKSGPHAWNIVKINGYYHHVDVTWDNQYSDSSNIPNYGYMNLSDEEMAKDHTWNPKHYPKCPYSPYNYFRVNNALFESKEQLEGFLYNSFMMEEEFIMFRVVRGSRLEPEVEGCLTDCIQRAVNRCKYIDIPTYQYGGIKEQLTFYIRPNYMYC